MPEIHDSRKKELIKPKGEQPVLSIHDSRKKGISTWPLSKRLILFIHNNKKTLKVLGVISFLLVFLLFPVWTGTIIGTWIKEFLGTIINIVKTI
jgi:hypothetical protein